MEYGAVVKWQSLLDGTGASFCKYFVSCTVQVGNKKIPQIGPLGVSACSIYALL
jgi:hypothetical protein